jgi:stress response protein YsnF
VVDKQTVAKERIGVTKDVDVEEETVTGEVRKERVEVEGDADQR